MSKESPESIAERALAAQEEQNRLLRELIAGQSKASINSDDPYNDPKQRLREAIEARPLNPETWWAGQETTSRTCLVWKAARSGNPQIGWRLIVPDLPPWIPAGETTAERFHPPEVERITKEVRAKLDPRDREVLRAIYLGTFNESTSHISYERGRQLRDSLTRDLKQKLYSELRLPALRLAGLSVGAAAGRCTFFVQILPDQPIPDIYWKALESVEAPSVAVIEPPIVEPPHVPIGLTRDEKDRLSDKPRSGGVGL